MDTELKEFINELNGRVGDKLQNYGFSRGAVGVMRADFIRGVKERFTFDTERDHAIEQMMKDEFGDMKQVKVRAFLGLPEVTRVVVCFARKDVVCRNLCDPAQSRHATRTTCQGTQGGGWFRVFDTGSTQGKTASGHHSTAASLPDFLPLVATHHAVFMDWRNIKHDGKIQPCLARSCMDESTTLDTAHWQQGFG